MLSSMILTRSTGVEHDSNNKKPRTLADMSNSKQSKLAIIIELGLAISLLISDCLPTKAAPHARHKREEPQVTTTSDFCLSSPTVWDKIVDMEGKHVESTYDMHIMRETYSRIPCRWVELHGFQYQWNMSTILPPVLMSFARQLANSITHLDYHSADTNEASIAPEDLQFVDRWLETKLSSNDDRLKLFLWLHLPPKMYDDFHEQLNLQRTDYDHKLIAWS